MTAEAEAAEAAEAAPAPGSPDAVAMIEEKYMLLAEARALLLRVGAFWRHRRTTTRSSPADSTALPRGSLSSTRLRLPLVFPLH